MGLTSSRQNKDGSWGGSRIALSDPKGISCPTRFKVDESAKDMFKGKKILVVCTETHLLECQNGRNFNTGHNPTELYVPLAHMAHAGFEFDFATSTGGKVPIEEFARAGVKKCGLEKVVATVEDANKAKTDSPIKISDSLENLKAGAYAMVFFPGGHAALNLKREDKASIGEILEHCHANSVLTGLICHGPDALRCAKEKTYEGYKVSAFTDKSDAFAAKVGYIPGKLKEEDLPQKNLVAEQGCIYTNKKNNDSVTVDRELITGSTNLAAQRFGAACIQFLKDAGKEEEKEEEK